MKLNEVLSDTLRASADRMGVPLSVLFHASWALLWQRYSGEEDITFGLVKGCLERKTADSETAVHIVPCRVLCEPDRTVRAWLRGLAEQGKETAPFEFISLEQIRAAAEIPSRVPLFETVLSVGHDAFDPLTIATAHAQADQSHAGADTYPMVAAVYPGREIALRVAWSPQRFSATAVQLLLGHWSTLLAALSARPDGAVSAVPMITPPERERLLSEWNATTASWPSTQCVHQLFDQQVQRTPDMPAVMFGSESLTYRDLNGRANALAHVLRSRNIGRDSVVGICVERSFDMAVSVLAVLKAGAAYLPLDPSYPHDRLQFMLQDSRAALLLTQTRLKNVFPDAGNLAFYLDGSWEVGLRLNHENPQNVTTPEDLSYLIYTSGSTGKPKGVAMVHRPLVNLVDWQLKQSVLLPTGARTLQFTSLSFDVSFQEIFSTWCSGGTLVLIPAELRLAPRELWRFIAEQKIARIFLPFVALQQLADAAALEGITATELREVITAGEQLQVTPRLRELFARHPNATLHNHYGPSETHVVTALTLDGDPQAWPDLPSIGRPIQNTQMYILDRHFEPVPVGLPGELFIGGVALARGYFERPEVTAEKFIPDPFSSSEKHHGTGSTQEKSASARLYKTGDLARYLPNGEIEFLGRIDHQVKIRGYRVELGEIEAALNRQPGVRESVVVAREPSPGEKQLVAYATPEKGAELSVNVLRQALKEHLPEYMVPAAFVFLAKLPLTPSGKVDRKALPPPEAQAMGTRTVNPAEKPWLPIQFQIVAIWEQLLGVKPVGIRDNFFELGGHSLLAVKMMDQVEAITGRKLPVSALFNEPTILHLSTLILGEEKPKAAPVIEVQTKGDKLPIYFLHGDIIGGGFYARDISRLLGDDQPFYVLPPNEISKDSLPNVEEIAIHHLRDLRAHRPRGPYLLGGFCVGALVAYEMACRLRAAGEEVPFVALIDPQLPSAWLRATYRFVETRGNKRRWNAQEKTRVFARGHKILYRLREEWNSPFTRKVAFAASKFRRLLGGTTAPDNAIPNDTSKAGVEGDQDILAVFHWIISGYHPPRCDGPLTVFLTDEQKALTPFLERKWRQAAPQVEIQRIAGDHLGAITKDVHVLAAKLKDCLERAVQAPNRA